jgi:multisubunit Na+/H+ antiporter MnhG subunit
LFNDVPQKTTNDGRIRSIVVSVLVLATAALIAEMLSEVKAKMILVPVRILITVPV